MQRPMDQSAGESKYDEIQHVISFLGVSASNCLQCFYTVALATEALPACKNPLRLSPG